MMKYLSIYMANACQKEEAGLHFAFVVFQETRSWNNKLEGSSNRLQRLITNRWIYVYSELHEQGY